MNMKELQKWLNQKSTELNIGITINTDGLGGPKTKDLFLKVMQNKQARAITEEELKEFANQLGDNSTTRIKAIAKVESNGSGWDNNGYVKILFERHYFYKQIQKTVNSKTFGLISTPASGGYTIDIDKNGINDNWDKLFEAMCTDVNSALSSVSVGKFQVMSKYYDLLGYNSPLDMIWNCSRNEKEHYRILVGYILNIGKLQHAYLKISTNPKDCVPFVLGYNGPNWIKNDYANKLAKAMGEQNGK